MHGFTVFDNNAYKSVRPDRLNRIMDAEKQARVVPLASVVVLQEMLARVRSVNPRERGQNRAAIRKLGVHCLATGAGQPRINFLSPVDSHVQRLLSGKQHPRDAEMFDAFGDMVRVIIEADADAPLNDISADLTAIEQLVVRVEGNYIDQLTRAVQANAQPNQMKRNLDYAARIAARAQAFYGSQFSPFDIVGKTIDMAKITSVGFALQDAIVEEIRTRGGGQAQHGNSAWDEEVVSSTSSYSTINGKTVILVTEEKRLLAAAQAAQAADRVVDLAAYEKLIGLSGWSAPPVSS